MAKRSKLDEAKKKLNKTHNALKDMQKEMQMLQKELPLLKEIATIEKLHDIIQEQSLAAKKNAAYIEKHAGRAENIFLSSQDHAERFHQLSETLVTLQEQVDSLRNDFSTLDNQKIDERHYLHKILSSFRENDLKRQ